MRQGDTSRSHPRTVAEETVVEEPEPELKVTGSFPSENPFGRTCSVRDPYERLINVHRRGQWRTQHH